MKYIKKYSTKGNYNIFYQDDYETKLVLDGEQSPKVIEWLKTNSFEVIPFVPMALADYQKQAKENMYSLGYSVISTLIPTMDLAMMNVVNPDAITTFLLPKALRLKYWNFLNTVKDEYVRLAQGITAATTNDGVDTIVASENYPTAIIG